MAKYRKKPVVIDAVRLTRRITVHTLEGDMVGEPGDWLITGIEGEQYPCKDSVFQATYEPVPEEPHRLVIPPQPEPLRPRWPDDVWAGDPPSPQTTWVSGPINVTSTA